MEKITKDRVEKLLREVPELRNNDLKLVWAFWSTYDTNRSELNTISRDEFVNILSNPACIIRLRALIQNEEGNYLPNNPEIRKQRRISQEKWDEYLHREVHKVDNPRERGELI